MRELPRQSRRSALAALAWAALGVTCGPPANAPDDLSVDVIAERYVRLTLQLAQHQPSLLESWLGPSSWRPGPRRPVVALHSEIARLAAEVESVRRDVNASSDRVQYLRRQVASLLLAARRLSGESMTFREEARAAFGEDAAALLPDPQVNVALSAEERRARADLEDRLPGRGPLQPRYVAFRTQQAIAPARLDATLHAALSLCRSQVRSHVPLPDDEQVQIEAANGIGFEAIASYHTRFRTQVRIDTSGPIDIARVVWLMAHESYPGHHMQHVLADRDLVQAHGAVERALYPAFGWHLLAAEGAAEAGAALLLDGDGFRAACRDLASAAGTPRSAIDDLVSVQRSVSSLDAAIARVAAAYLDHTVNREAAVEQLTAEALVPDAKQLLALIERQRTRVLAYPIGRRLVSGHVVAAPAERRWDRLAQIARTLVLPA
jgi:hypothetical protein